MTSPVQLPLGFAHRPALGGDAFFVAPCNAEAVAWIDRWPDWPAPALVVHGPPGCGKTHLANVFLAASGGRIAAFGAPDAPDAPAYVVEDAEEQLAGRAAQTAAFHFYNRAAERGRRLLLTARRPASRWDIGLADLRSRLNAALSIGIGPPDDDALGAVLAKLFADRQLRVGTEVRDFVLARMERSYDAARRLVAALDAAALAERRNITVPLAAKVLETLSGPPDPADG